MADVEAQAREIGWAPKEDWTGDPERWMPADEFVARNERILGKADKIAKAEIARLEKAMQEQADEFKATVSDVKAMVSNAERRGYEKGVQEALKRARAAAAAGDTEAYDDAMKEIVDLQGEMQKAADKPKDEKKSQITDAEAAFRKANTWYDDDIKMTAYADSIAQTVARKGRHAGPTKAFFEDLAAAVRAEFPDRFGDDGDRPAAVASGSGSKRAEGDYANWPQWMKDGFQRQVKHKLLENTPADRKYYFEEMKEAQR